jgi:hypothetical protein
MLCLDSSWISDDCDDPDRNSLACFCTLTDATGELWDGRLHSCGDCYHDRYGLPKDWSPEIVQNYDLWAMLIEGLHRPGISF